MQTTKGRIRKLEKQAERFFQSTPHKIIIVPPNTTKTAGMARLGVTSEDGRIFIILPEGCEYET